MKSLIDKIAMLSEYRTKLKHLRGRHDQLDHAWNRGMGRGGGGALADNQMGPLPTDDFYRQRKIALMDQKRNGEISQSEMNRQLRDLRGMTNDTASVVLANRGKNPIVASPKSSLRPERSARLPIAHTSIGNPARRRAIAQQQQQEWKRRHRMTKAMAPNQGLVSPSAMYDTPIEPRYGELTYDDTNPNLFENPSRIEGVDFNGDPISQIDFHESQMEIVQAQIESQLQEIVDAGTITEDQAEEMYMQILSAEQIIRQAVMRKAAASFAMDIQGFVGGEVYSTTDPEYEASVNMATQANQTISLQRSIVNELCQQLFEMAGSDEARKFFQEELIDRLIDAPYRDWAALQMKNLGLESATVARMSRVNPTLTTDVIERSIEQSSGAIVPSKQQFENSLGSTGLDLNRTATDTDTLAMTMPALMSFLHPSIQQQLKRLMQSEIKYPVNENPSSVISEIPTEPLSIQARAALDILSGLVDAVHTDGGLADLAVVDVEADDFEGFFTNQHAAMAGYGISDVGAPVVAIARAETKGQDLPYPIMSLLGTMAHEFGHHIDVTALPFGSAYWREEIEIYYQGLRVEKNNPSLTAIIGKLGGVPPEFADKAAMAPHILAIMAAYHAKVQSRNQAFVKGKPRHVQQKMQSFMQYLDQPSEVFARLYAQWMMTRLHERLSSGLPVPGIADADRDRAKQSIEIELAKERGETVVNGQIVPSSGQRIVYNFDPGDEPFAELESLLATMGWRIK